MSINNLYHTVHSPRGANASFGLGAYLVGGGFAVEQDRVAEQDVFIGYREAKLLNCFPFNSTKQRLDFSSFNIEDDPNDEYVKFRAFDKKEIHRENLYATDVFSAGKVKYEICTPVDGIDLLEDIKFQTMPALLSKITFDNRDGKEEIEGIFAIGPDKAKLFIDDGQLLGYKSKSGYGFCVKKSDDVCLATTHEVFAVFCMEYMKWYNTAVNCLIFKVKPGEIKTFDIALGFFKDTKTFGQMEMKYYYTNYFSDVIDVMKYCLDNADKIYTQSIKKNLYLKNSGLNEYRQLMLAQATKSYFASSMLFDNKGKMEWLVNEGSFLMINTLDLAADHLFYELEMQPWSVKSQLDTFADSYFYYDTVHLPNDKLKSYPGGISFCHDIGLYNIFTPKGTSSYEIPNVHGVFSYMSQEQLCNFILCSALYVNKTKDFAWLHKRRGLVYQLYESMKNRDHYDESMRDGIQDLESDKVGKGKEATTYDNLDPSLVSASRGLYLSVKCFSSYYALYKLFSFLEDKKQAEKAYASAKLCEKTIISYYDDELGYIPAALKKDKKYAAIIPAIEGLIFPAYLSGNCVYDEEFNGIYSILKKHFTNIFKKGICQKDDGSWYLSSSSKVKFMSKTILNQFIAEKILKINFEDILEQDKAHLLDWVEVHPTCPSIDQTQPSNDRNFHYPRAITSILWLIGEKNILSMEENHEKI